MGNEGQPPGGLPRPSQPAIAQPQGTQRTVFGVPAPQLPLGTPRPPQRVTPTAMPAQAPVSQPGAFPVYQTEATGYTSQPGQTEATYPTEAAGYASQPGPQTGYPSTMADAPRKAQTTGLDLVPGAYINHYELIRELGRGGMGVVYAARDTRLGRRVAMKFLLNASQSVADRFLVEARATAQCNHENIIVIHEVDQLDALPYMVLEFLEGQELRKQLGPYNSGIRLPASRVIELMLPVARALARAHQLGIVHRDLKPENIFVTSAGQVKVLDFGIAKAMTQHDAAAPRTTRAMGAATANLNLTGEGGLVGTLPYMSPEQLGVDAVDHRSDIWTFGIMLYEMLVGYHPVEPLTPSQLMLSAGSTDEPMPSPLQSVHDLDPTLARIVDLCLRKRKQERLGTAAELVRKLEELLPGRRGRQLAEGESPYPGLTAFQETDADRFFGRSRDVARMVSRVRENPLTGVIGPSGVGKSSFVRAGVGPALKASGENWEVVTIRPGRHPLAALSSIAHRLTTRSGPFEGHLGEHDELMRRLRHEPGFLGSLLRQRARVVGGNILLFVDQFEELYTLVPDIEERRAFTAALAGVADDSASPLRVVVSMRSDFLDRVAEDPRFMDDLSRGLVFLQPPDRGGLRDALVQPIEMIGHRFESLEIVDDMLNALGTTTGALPLLQFAAAKLWDARDRQNRVLTVASYRAIGGISGALATHADEVVANMNAPAQKLTQRICRRLVTPERTRAIVELADLHQLTADPTDAGRVLDQLVAARLLVIQTRGDGGGGTVEIVHESLIERWPTLRRWLDEDQEDAAYVAQLAAAAKQWDAKGRPSGLLWRGDAMEESRRWFNQRPRELAPRDKAFLDAVFSLAQRGKRMRRMALVITFLALAGVAAGAMVMLVRVRAAEQNATEGMHQATDALAQLQEKDRLRREAEAKQKLAEANTTKAELDKAKAELDKATIEQQAKAQQQMSREELEKQNAKLAAQAEALTLEKTKVMAAMKDLKEAKAKVDQLAAEQKARIIELEKTKKNAGPVSTQLKDKL